jgi:hypothetical protein
MKDRVVRIVATFSGGVNGVVWRQITHEFPFSCWHAWSVVGPVSHCREVLVFVNFVETVRSVCIRVER